jgi:hypothetical protein
MIEEEKEDDEGKGGAGDPPPAFVLPFPFEKEYAVADEALPPAEFWYDGSYAKVDWWSMMIVWGRWSYDAKTKKLKHALTQRSFNMAYLNTPEKLLRAMTSLMIQPQGDVEQFYQLASGVLKKRHGIEWQNFWGEGAVILDKPPIEKPKPIQVFGGRL